MKKPIIRISWSKMRQEDMKQLGFESQQPIYKLYLPFEDNYSLSTYNANDCLLSIICRDIGDTWDEETPIMQAGNKSLVWNGKDWERVIGAPLPKYPSLDPRYNPTSYPQ